LLKEGAILSGHFREVLFEEVIYEMRSEDMKEPTI
jgi:hypothetical protein